MPTLARAADTALRRRLSTGQLGAQSAVLGVCMVLAMLHNALVPQTFLTLGTNAKRLLGLPIPDDAAPSQQPLAATA